MALCGIHLIWSCACIQNFRCYMNTAWYLTEFAVHFFYSLKCQFLFTVRKWQVVTLVRVGLALPDLCSEPFLLLNLLNLALWKYSVVFAQVSFIICVPFASRTLNQFTLATVKYFLIPIALLKPLSACTINSRKGNYNCFVIVIDHFIVMKFNCIHVPLKYWNHLEYCAGQLCVV